MVFTLPEFKRVLNSQPHQLGSTRIYVLTVGRQGLRRSEADLPDLLSETDRLPTVAMEGRVVSLVVWDNQDKRTDVE